MKLKQKKLPVMLFIIFLLISCGGTSGSNGSNSNSDDAVINELFEESNRPALEYNIAGDFFLVKPWNYEKDYNARRNYPLLVYLHGSSQIKYLKNLYYMGMGYCTWSDAIQNFTEEYQKTIADNFRTAYPCFMYVPQGPSGWDTAKLIEQIETFKTDYRIDANRIYIHGFSMGGSGAYALARAYYTQKEQLFAGIIRLDGASSNVSLPDSIVEKTPIWLVVGGKSPYLSIEENAYIFLKDHPLNAGAVETQKLNYYVSDTIDASNPDLRLANTITLTRDGTEFVKQTKFPNANHFVTCFPFEDQDMFAWLFKQSLKR